ncbi:hypothetical protein V8B97DRAFT_1904403 [Scleroderma yunnanense]
MGPTGVGKSSFIRNSVPSIWRAKVKIGHGLQSKTNRVQSVRWATTDDITVKLVDTPSFDDSRTGVTDTDVLEMIATFLINRRNGLTGLIYVHRISDTRVGGNAQRNLRMFRNLCGDESLKNVVIVTTMWDKVTPEEGSQREQELRSSDSLFKPLLDKGAIMMRHDNTPESATNVINYLLKKSPTTIRIVMEIVQQRKPLEGTAASTELHGEIQTPLKKHREEMVSLKAEIHEIMQKELAADRERMDGAMSKLLKEVDELKRGIAIGNDTLLAYEAASHFPAPETKCIKHGCKLLRLVKFNESWLDHQPVFPMSAATRTMQFADAVERSVNDIRLKSSGLKTALALGDMDVLELFMMVGPYSRTLIEETWAKAQDDMKNVGDDIEVLLIGYPKPGFADWISNGQGVNRFIAMKEVLECTRNVVTDMETMVDWWTSIFDTMRNVEDAIRRNKEEIGFPDNTMRVALTRIIRALDAYCEAYAKCPKELRRAAIGIPGF